MISLPLYMFAHLYMGPSQEGMRRCTVDATRKQRGNVLDIRSFPRLSCRVGRWSGISRNELVAQVEYAYALFERKSQVRVPDVLDITLKGLGTTQPFPRWSGVHVRCKTRLPFLSAHTEFPQLHRLGLYWNISITNLGRSSN